MKEEKIRDFEENNKIRALINSFQGTEIHTILTERIKDLNLLSNPDE